MNRTLSRGIAPWLTAFVAYVSACNNAAVSGGVDSPGQVPASNSQAARAASSTAPGEVSSEGGGLLVGSTALSPKTNDATPVVDVGLQFVAELELALVGDSTLLGREPLLVEVNQGVLRVRPELSPGLPENLLGMKYSLVGRWPTNAYLTSTVESPGTTTRLTAHYFDGKHWRKVNNLPLLAGRVPAVSLGFAAAAASSRRLFSVVHVWALPDAARDSIATSYLVFEFDNGRAKTRYEPQGESDARCPTQVVLPSVISESAGELVVAGYNCHDVFGEQANAVLLETFSHGRKSGTVTKLDGWDPNTWPDPKHLTHVGNDLFLVVEVRPKNNDSGRAVLLQRETNFGKVALPGEGEVRALRGTSDTLWLVRGGVLFGRRADAWFRVALDREVEVKAIQLDSAEKLWVETTAGTYWQGHMDSPIRKVVTEGPLSTPDCLLGEVIVEFPARETPGRIPAIKNIAKTLYDFPLDEMLLTDLGDTLQFIGATERVIQLQRRLSTLNPVSRCGWSVYQGVRSRLDTKRGWLVGPQPFEASQLVAGE